MNELKKRVEALERKEQIVPSAAWRETVGFARDDELFDEAMRLGAEWRAKRERPGREQVPAYRQFQHTRAAFQKYVVLPFDADAAGVFHRLQGERIRAGTMDLKIAAICIAHHATLLTRNLADFEKVPGLRVENWLD